jgi:hypothetical protein
MIRGIRAVSTLPSEPISAQISDALIANTQVSVVRASLGLQRDPSQVLRLNRHSVSQTRHHGWRRRAGYRRGTRDQTAVMVISRLMELCIPGRGCA